MNRSVGSFRWRLYLGWLAAPMAREITGKVYRGHLFARLLLDRHPIFYVHEAMPFSMPRVIASL